MKSQIPGIVAVLNEKAAGYEETIEVAAEGLRIAELTVEKAKAVYENQTETVQNQLRRINITVSTLQSMYD